MPKGAKKRAKLKKQQQQGHPDDAGNTNASNGNCNGCDDNNSASSGRDGDHHLRIPPKVSLDANEDSMESSEEMVTPRAAASEPDEEETKATAAEVPVERTVDADVAGSGEVIVDAFPPETVGQEREGKVDEAEVEVHAVVAQEPEVKDVVVAEESVVQEPVSDAPVAEASEVKELAKVHSVLESEPRVDEGRDEVVVVDETPVVPEVQEPEVKGVDATVVLKEQEKNSGNVVAKDSAEVSRSQEAAGVHITEVERGPAVAVIAPGQRAIWWNFCGLFDAFTGSGR
ncbi:uncharacterized protein LOC100276470 [Zea mays]|uniref:Uncharacterized protein n=1 Tax=Zea mays TaxID=4577 RepID=A0A1D6NEL0_MAIZE|nr:uncharacterized protein LOC100276470 [Zea mays]ONM38920.1 hypothetical protein ZEAMMB73_Zm00001d043736 [Zea mays]|eukprot:NP_001143724.2 uncharacterized protein LOC100276470 [Zea mays]